MKNDIEVKTTADFDRQFGRDLGAAHQLLLAYARKHYGREHAEDCVQETMRKAWQSRATFRPETNFVAWLFTILRNTRCSELRREWRQAPMTDGAMATLITAQNGAEHAALLEQVRKIYNALPAPQREALILVACLGGTYEEAAAVTNAPIGTLKSRVARARVAVNEALESYEAKLRLLSSTNHVRAGRARRESRAA